MSRLRRKHIYSVDKVVEQLGLCRAQMIEVMRGKRMSSALYRSAEAVRDEIDQLTLMLTGRKDYFWSKDASGR